MQSLGLIKAPLKRFSVLITGGGSGISLSTAELFAEMIVHRNLNKDTLYNLFIICLK